MRYTSSILTVAALASVAIASDAPVVQNNPIEVTYSATIPTGANAKAISGAIKVAASPDGEGVNIQVALYNLPDTGDLNYGLYSGNVASLSDCSDAGALLNPYGGFTGSKCASDKAGCAIGDLSDKYGEAKVISGGSGTGYFSANYPDKYLSMVPNSEAFFGKGSFAVTDSTGAYVACANFVNANKASNAKESKQAAHHATKPTPSASASASSGSNGDGSTTTSGGFAAQTAVPVVAAGVLGLAALLI